MNSEYRLEITDLSLTRGFRRVVTGLNAQISAGQAVWLFGANGAGKTTLLRALAGFIRPAAGAILWHGIADWRDQILFLPARAPVKAALTVREQWQLWQKIFNRSGEIPAALNLENHLDQRIGKLSMGQQRRLVLALLTLADKKIWLLDEAFNHLDDTGATWLLTQIQEKVLQNGIVMIAAPTAPPDDQFITVKL